MNAATAISLILSVLFICITWYNIVARKLERDEHAERCASDMQKQQLVRDMADKGYLQVPVPCRHLQESINDDDGYDEDTSRVTDDRTWQLAWTHKEQAELLLAFNTDAEDSPLIEEALRPS
jgi:hypothetical protein